MNKIKKRLIRLLPLALVLVFTTIAGGGMLWVFQSFLDQPVAPPKQTIQEVRLIRPPPPPEEVEPPPPPEVEEEVDVPEPEAPIDAPADDQPPPSNMLGLDTEGVAGSDGFGLRAGGGRDLLAGSGGSRFGWYAGVLKEDLLSFLSDYDDLRRRSYQVDLRLWLNDDGTVMRVNLDSSTGNRELDEQLRTRLASLDRVGESPPADLPQPIQIRIVSRL
jgi:protein TonB